MTRKDLDCRGLACPGPVLKTKEMVDQGGLESITVLVDNPAARENVSRCLSRSGYQVQVAEEGGTFVVTGVRPGVGPCELMAPAPGAAAALPPKVLVLVGADRLGRGDDSLGEKLMASFLGTLKELGQELWCLVCLNAGVRLAVTGSPVLDRLQELEAAGVQVLVCGTCLNHFQLLEAKQVGETTNMLDIVSHMRLADKVISLT
ncbi:MAG: sulfurtransferase-like selenium metabolism protein YedF [Deltaproteobacteria bacterium]|nr:sulfurtransferase-like selenium metabolism protein YedF [Deltaproteobacteria bacterium]